MSEALVIADTCPLINLAGIGQIELLPRFYGAVSIPRQVATEFAGGAAAIDPVLDWFPWLTVVDNVLVDQSLPGNLGAGEAAAITLALTTRTRVILLDEKRARTVAQQLGHPVAGTLAILLRAKQHLVLPAVAPAIEAMLRQGRRFSLALVARVLSAADELDALDTLPVE